MDINLTVYKYKGIQKSYSEDGFIYKLNVERFVYTQTHTYIYIHIYILKHHQSIVYMGCCIFCNLSNFESETKKKRKTFVLYNWWESSVSISGDVKGIGTFS